jgi:hypothetical protein
MTHSTFVDYLRAACTSALLASQAHAQTRGAVAFAPGGTTCTSRVARPFGSLPGENVVRPPTALKSSQAGAGPFDAVEFAPNPPNALAPRLFATGGVPYSRAEGNVIAPNGGRGRGGHAGGSGHARGNVIRGGLHGGRSPGYAANRKAPDVAGRAVRRLK